MSAKSMSLLVCIISMWVVSNWNRFAEIERQDGKKRKKKIEENFTNVAGPPTVCMLCIRIERVPVKVLHTVYSDNFMPHFLVALSTFYLAS